MRTANGTMTSVGTVTVLRLFAALAREALEELRELPRRQGGASGRAAAAEPPRPACREVVIAPGDTAAELAEAHGMATASFLVLNGLRWGAPLAIGATVLVASTPSAAAPRRWRGADDDRELVRRVVRDGERLEDIAAELGLGIAVLLRANGIAAPGAIYPGLALVAPARVDPRDTGEIPLPRGRAHAPAVPLEARAA